ncbi:Arylsulfatase B [Holothuria leucospilota]|uniref:Arylsulfatase B n=1 Tax=Holothuria leucospilota TaxID=206669 RepID=A0A9Q1BMI4_HOLLE|nr:Arylsulfatase B [Holothuria leucospilota]
MAVMMSIKLPLLATVITVSAFAANPRPHIIIMLADDLGYSDVSYHSSVSGSVIKTPNINDLAKNGVTLENYYVQPTCTPTRSQLLTGRYQIHTGLMHGVIQPPQPSCIPLNETLLPEIMKDYGYSTHIVGKWHLGMYKPACLPTERGFDSHFGILLGAGKYYSHTYSYNLKAEGVTMEGKDFRFTTDGVDDDKVQETYKGIYATTAYVERVKEIIDETAESSSVSYSLRY